MTRIFLAVTCAVLCLLSPSISSAAPEAFIPPKFKGIILSAPLPEFPRGLRNRFAYGNRGIYRLAVDRGGSVEQVSVLHRADQAKLNATAVVELMKWKFKPGAIKQL